MKRLTRTGQRPELSSTLACANIAPPRLLSYTAVMLRSSTEHLAAHGVAILCKGGRISGFRGRHP
jgi:hypothetical protein